MKYNFKFLENVYNNIIKFGKVKSNYFRLKKIFNKLICKLIGYFKKKVKLYLIKLFYRKGDFTLIGELGIIDYDLIKIKLIK